MKLKCDYEDEIRDKTAERNRYVSILHKLEELRDDLIWQRTKLMEYVQTPVAQYMLAGGSSEDWKGANYNIAEEKRTSINSALSGYAGNAAKLNSEIDSAIQDVSDKIESLNREIDDLWEAWEHAPEHEPEPEPQNGN